MKTRRSNGENKRRKAGEQDNAHGVKKKNGKAKKRM
jgi:hypothetical protein